MDKPTRLKKSSPRPASALEPVTVESKAAEYALGSPDFATPRLTTTDFPEYVAILLEAVWHFKIDKKAGKYPKHEELVAYFVTRRLSDGRLISVRQAHALATFCRPVGAMKGGNSKRGERWNIRVP
jgi:hypothetical protein